MIEGRILGASLDLLEEFMAQVHRIGPGDYPVTVDEVLAAIDQLLAGHAEAPDAITVPGALGIVRGLVAGMPASAGSPPADGPDAVVLSLSPRDT